MKVAVIANNELKIELLRQGLRQDESIEWLSELKVIAGTDCYIDLLFEYLPERISVLKELSSALIIVNEVCHTLNDLPENFIRINGWPGFIAGELIEAAGRNAVVKEKTATVFTYFGKKIEWVADTPGLIGARVVSMIINEAYMALDEGVSTREEIDEAMKLGTNYPYGPFEWGKKIGLKRVIELLKSLPAINEGFQPSSLLTNESKK